MRGTARQTEDYATEDVRVEGLLSLAFLEGLSPVGGSELEDAVTGPAREEAEQIPHVGEGLDLMQAAAGQKRHDGRIDLASVIATDEEPVLSPDDLAAQVQLRDIVVHGQSAVVEKATKRRALVSRVPDPLSHRGQVEHTPGFLIAPPEEGVDNRGRSRLTDLAALLCRRTRHRPLDREEGSDPGERGLRALRV